MQKLNKSDDARMTRVTVSSDRFAAYAVAAGAALTLTQAASAAVVYSGPQNLNIGQFGSLNLDLDLDGNGDVKLKNYVFGGGNYQGATVNFAPGKIVGFNGAFAYVTKLNTGAPISAATAGPTFYGSMAYGANNPLAQFNNVTDAFLGLSFPSGSDLFYGWVRVDINNANGTFLVKDWAYNDENGVAINAGDGIPEPASLGLLAMGALGLAAYRNRDPRPRRIVSRENPRSAKRVLLVGWDGADWEFINPLIKRGLMPTLASLRERSAWGQIATLHPVLSPMLWTSIATGKRPDDHGVLGFVEPDPSGSGVRPVASTSRKCKAVWNVLNQNGLRSNVIGWYATRPAEPINGVIVADRFEMPVARSSEPWPVPAGSVHPESMSDELASLRLHPDEIDPFAILPFVPDAAKIDQRRDRRLRSIQSLVAQISSIHAIATHLIEKTEWDLTAVYYEGIDRFGHEFMQFHPPRMSNVSEEDFALYQHVMTGCYRFHDMLLERLLKLAGDETTVILVSDHGYLHDARRPADEKTDPTEWHRNFGIACAAGPGVRAGARLFGATVLDVTPTVLSLLGVAPARDMAGRPWLEVLEPAPQIQPVDSWESIAGEDGRHPADVAVDSVGAHESIRQLVELGYIDAPSDDAAKASQQAADLSQLNLAAALLDAGKAHRAAEVLELLRQRFPASASIAMQLAIAKASAGEFDDARVIATKLLDQVAASCRAHLLLGVLDVLDGRIESGLAHLSAVALANPQQVGIQVRLGTTYLTAKRFDEARRAFDRALAIDPDQPAALDGMAQISLAEGDPERAIELSLSATERAFHFPRAHLHLAEGLEQIGRPEKAVDAARLALAQAPTLVPAHALLARLYERLNRPELALPHRLQAQAASRFPVR